ncbi:hypothetical protein LINPERHAP1_LOCUS44194 [Linum perenne]
MKKIRKDLVKKTQIQFILFRF